MGIQIFHDALGQVLDPHAAEGGDVAVDRLPIGLTLLGQLIQGGQKIGRIGDVAVAQQWALTRLGLVGLVKRTFDTPTQLVVLDKVIEHVEGLHQLRLIAARCRRQLQKGLRHLRSEELEQGPA